MEKVTPRPFMRFAGATVMISVFVLAFFQPWADLTERGRGTPSVGHASYANLVGAFQRWKEIYTSQGGQDRPLTVNLLWNKALSREFTASQGYARIDLSTGAVSVEVKGLKDPEVSRVWLVDNVPGAGRSALPEAGDKMIYAGNLRMEDGLAQLQSSLEPSLLEDFQIDWVVVARPGEDLGEVGVLYGSVALFQKIHHFGDRNAGAEAGLMAALAPATVHANGLTPPNFPNAAQLNFGRELFFEETFDGNGRTCGTCHPAENNFTIDPDFIATLPKNDILFIAEFPDTPFNPNPLKENFEKPELMRKVGLILENTNGFGDLVNNFTMRGVPHTLALGIALEPANDGTAVPPDDRTGWSGDGSPVDLNANPQLRGTLRDFAVGAVTQHFTKTLNRIRGVDFRIPTEAELDALEAFQLSLGRQTELDLDSLTFKNEVVARGKELFQGDGVGGLACNACHFNAGANTDPAVFGESANRNFNTNVEGLPDQPADLIDPANNPADDGFGNPGNNTFNTPVLVEAADTGPFFHNNSVETIEAAVAFYTGPSINITIMDGSQVTAIAAFLRVINAVESLRIASVLEKKAQNFNDLASASVNIKLAIEETGDAIEVLQCGNLHPEVIPILNKVIGLDRQALRNTNPAKRLELLEKSKKLKDQASNLMVM